MQNLNESAKVPRRSYRPKQRLCPICHSVLKGSHILWRNRLIFLTGPVDATSRAYRCVLTRLALAPMGNTPPRKPRRSI